MTKKMKKFNILKIIKKIKGKKIIKELEKKVRLVSIVI